MKKLCSHCQATMKEEWLKFNLEKGIPLTEVAKLAGRHENTLYNWKARYGKEGVAGLTDKSKAPISHANEYSEETKERIRGLRHEGLDKEKRYIGEDVMRMGFLKDTALKLLIPA